MKCQRCESEQVISISAKCSDRCFTTFPDGTGKDGYVPYISGLGGGDYLDVDICLDCGQAQGTWPQQVPEE